MLRALLAARYLLGLTASSRPAWITAMDQDAPGGAGGAAFDCSWRRLAYSYAQQLQTVTESMAVDIFAALELRTMCNETFDATTHRPASAMPKTGPGSDWSKSHIYVEAVKGSDSNTCTSPKAPCETLHGALYRVRKLPCRGPHPPPKKKGEKGKRCDVQIFLRKGTCAQPQPPRARRLLPQSAPPRRIHLSCMTSRKC